MIDPAHAPVCLNASATPIPAATARFSETAFLQCSIYVL
jgi:hypothetical protein